MLQKLLHSVKYVRCPHNQTLLTVTALLPRPCVLASRLSSS
jgi:hypothetical protein